MPLPPPPAKVLPRGGAQRVRRAGQGEIRFKTFFGRLIYNKPTDEMKTTTPKKAPLELEFLSLESLIPYARNSRTHSDEQVAQIAGSIKEFGFTNPVLIGGENDIIAGHGRVLAARKLALKEVPCIRLGHLSDIQKRAYVIADNQLALNAGWNEELLGLELSELRTENFDLGLVGFDAEAIERFLVGEDGETGSSSEQGEGSGDSDAYTKKIEAPQYVPKGEKPPVNDLLNETKTAALMAKVEDSNLPDDVKRFLKAAAQRHTVFDFEKIAEFYAHADKATQLLMEDSALVIIDFNKAIENGFVKLSESIKQLYSEDGSIEDEDEEQEETDEE